LLNISISIQTIYGTLIILCMFQSLQTSFLKLPVTYNYMIHQTLIENYNARVQWDITDVNKLNTKYSAVKTIRSTYC